MMIKYLKLVEKNLCVARILTNLVVFLNSLATLVMFWVSRIGPKLKLRETSKRGVMYIVDRVYQVEPHKS